MTRNTPKPDNRTDNVEKIQDTVKNTIANMEAAEETMAFTDGRELEALKEKNARRKESINGLREEIVDEATDRKNGYSKK
jgi:small acid-soluble spore protein (thioredoxin-like protein)